MSKWQVKYFESSPGKFPIHDFLESFDIMVRAKIANTIELLKEKSLGPDLVHLILKK